MKVYRAGWWAAHTEPEGGGGVFFAESFFRNGGEGRWLVLGGIEAQSWGLWVGRE